MRQSMTRGGAPGENAQMESFFHSLESDVIDDRAIQAVADLRGQLRRDIRYYNYHACIRSWDVSRPLTYERRTA